MSRGFYKTFSPLNSYPKLITKTYNLQIPGNILQYLCSKQTLEIQLSDQFIKSICTPYQLEVFNGNIKLDDDDLYDYELDPNNNYDTIQFFGSLNRFKISTSFIQYYKKRKLKKSYITVFAIQKATKIPAILSNCKRNINLHQELNVDIPKNITYSIFDDTEYNILDSAQTGLQVPVYTLAINIPYSYYSLAMPITDQQCCFDIINNKFWFASSNIEHYQSLLTDIATNGIYNPIGLRLGPNGQITSTEDTRTRTLIALHLKLPYIPAIVYMTNYNSQQPNNLQLDFKKQANQLFNPYFMFE